MRIFEPEPDRSSLPRRPGLARSAGLLLAVGSSAIAAAGRRPLPLLIAGEVAVCLALGLAAWHLVGAAASEPASVPPPATLVASSPEAPPPAPPAGAIPATAAGHPGLGTGAGFLGGMLAGLNRDEADLEHTEWDALQAFSAAIRAYLERVVVPAVEQAVHSGRR